MLGRNDAEVLKRELIGLFEHIQRIRQEIASIRRPSADGGADHFMRMSDELDAIVEATEGATNTIMENVEQMEDVLADVRGMTTDPRILTLLDTIPEKTSAIFEACAFQDITGQRITKVVNSMQFVETRVNALINMWGADALNKVEPADSNDDARIGDQKLLNGPQLAGQGVSQADVDALFGPVGIPSILPAMAPPARPAAAPAPVAAPVAAPQAARATPQAAAARPAQPAAARPAAPPPPRPAPPPSAPPAPPAKVVAAKPAPAKPAAKASPPASASDASGAGPALGQDDIDKLFG